MAQNKKTLENPYKATLNLWAPQATELIGISFNKYNKIHFSQWKRRDELKIAIWDVRTLYSAGVMHEFRSLCTN